MKTSRNAAVAAAHSVKPERWRRGFDAVLDRLAPRFAPHEPLRHAGALMLGLLSDLGRKNCWTIAERSGHAAPDRLQHLPSRAMWDADAVRDDLRSYVVEHLEDEDAVLVVVDVERIADRSDRGQHAVEEQGLTEVDRGVLAG